MSLPNGSASATDRTIKCPAWLSLPHIERASEDAEAGHEKHGYVRAVLEGIAPQVAIERVSAENRATCVQIDWSRLGSDIEPPIETEGAYAIDVRARTARYLGSNLQRRYVAAAKALGQPLGEWEVPGSLDLAGRQRGNRRRIIVIDLKSGWREPVAAEASGQGRFFAAAKFLLEDDVDEVEFRIAHAKTSGAIWDGDRVVFNRLDADAFLDDLEDAVEQSKEARRIVEAGRIPDVSAGEWCRYCPAQENCPSVHALVRNLLPELSAVDGRIEAMTREELGAVWAKRDQIAPYWERLNVTLKDCILREEVVPLPDGQHEARAIRYNQNRLVHKRALQLLEQLGATHEQVSWCFSEHEVEKVQTCAVKRPRKRRNDNGNEGTDPRF